MTDDNNTARRTPGEGAGSEDLREGTAGGASSARGLEGQNSDPDMGADMSDTGGAQWDSVIKAGGIQNEPGLEGLRQDTGDATS